MDIRITILHNIHPYADLGLNVWRTHQGERLLVSPDERHPLVRVFSYNVSSEPQDDEEYAEHVAYLLEQVFETFNIGENAIALRYREHHLRSLCVGDVVLIGESAYTCESFGWKPVGLADLFIVEGSEAERMIRLRYHLDPHEPLILTVPLPAQEGVHNA